MKRITAFFVTALVLTALCAAQNHVSENPFIQEGIASWYGAEFEGKPTASGEIFNASLLTAAHPTLPFGTMLKITNKHNNKTVIVRVNDRGPFVAARIIDLSRAAAQQLDMIKTGTAPVLVERTAAAVTENVPAEQAAGQTGEEVAEVPAAEEALEPAPVKLQPLVQPPSRNPARVAELKGAVPTGSVSKLYRIQVGAYVQPRNAVETFERLKDAGLNPAYEKHNEFYRVVLAGVKTAEIRTIAEKLGQAGFHEAIIREEN